MINLSNRNMSWHAFLRAAADTTMMLPAAVNSAVRRVKRPNIMNTLSISFLILAAALPSLISCTLSHEMKWTHFTIAKPLPGSGYGTGSIGLADYDGDGDLDIALSRRSELTAYWFERKSDSLWIRHDMGSSKHLARALGADAVDVDRDGCWAGV